MYNVIKIYMYIEVLHIRIFVGGIRYVPKYQQFNSLISYCIILINTII